MNRTTNRARHLFSVLFGGLLVMQPASMLFAQELAIYQASRVGVAETDDDAGENLEPWAESLRLQLELTVRLVDVVDLERSHEPVFAMLDDDAMTTIDFELDAGATFLIALCDENCTDIDLVVETADGKPVAAAREADDNPVTGFVVPGEGARYRVSVGMVACSREPCGFVVQAYAAYPPGSRQASSSAETEAAEGGGAAETYPGTADGDRVPFVAPPKLVEEIRTGFEDVEPGSWEKWMAANGEAGMVGTMRLTAMAIVKHTTDEEFLQVIEWRMNTFREIADDPSANAACGPNPLAGPTPDYSAFEFGDVARIFGRALARDFTGDEPWTPPEAFTENGRGIGSAFAHYMHDNGHDEVLIPFAQLGQGGTMDNRAWCLWQADLYQVAVEAPDDSVGPIRVLELVRILESIGLGEIFGS